MHIYHENLRFDLKSKAVEYQCANGLAWSHYIGYDGRGYRCYPHIHRLNAEQLKNYIKD